MSQSTLVPYYDSSTHHLPAHSQELDPPTTLVDPFKSLELLLHHLDGAQSTSDIELGELEAGRQTTEEEALPVPTTTKRLRSRWAPIVRIILQFTLCCLPNLICGARLTAIVSGSQGIATAEVLVWLPVQLLSLYYPLSRLVWETSLRSNSRLARHDQFIIATITSLGFALAIGIPLAFFWRILQEYLNYNANS